MLWPETTQRGPTGQFCIGGVSIPELAAELGTPLYVFDEATLRRRARRVRTAMEAAYPLSRVLYAAKAYLSPAIARIFYEEGLGLDVVSGGEIYGGILAGVPPSEMTFHGNNKSSQELREAVTLGVGLIVIDNELELERLAQLTASVGTTVPVALRLNPGIDVHTHAKVRTGTVDSKFGFPIWTGDAEAACERAAGAKGLDVIGFHSHLGSQLFDPGACRLAVRRLLEFSALARNRFAVVARMISPGGGLGIAYTPQDEEAALEAWACAAADEARSACAELDLPLPELVVEPGRYLVGPAGVAVYEVGATKPIEGVRDYVSVDGGMADNIRPSLYGAVYTAELANRDNKGARRTVTIAGRYCESGDLLIENAELPELRPGDLIAMPSAGAYALPMASNYNAVPRPAVVLVNDGKARLIRRRERYSDVFACDLVEPHREAPV